MPTRYRVVRLDLPGFGLTGTYTDARTMEILGDLIDLLEVDRASLISKSLAGRIAWNSAAMHLEWMMNLVLISPGGFASAGFDFDKQSEVPLIMRALPYTAPHSMLNANLAAVYGNPEALSEQACPATVT